MVRNRFHTGVVSSLLCAAWPLAAQFSVSASVNMTEASVTYKPSPDFRMLPRISAPYSGKLVAESVQTLTDGGHLSRTIPMSSTWRDSLGRVRTERPLFQGSPAYGPEDGPKTITVLDPVNGHAYLLDAVNHIAHRVPLRVLPPPPGGMPGPPQPGPPSTFTSPDGTVNTNEYLGVKAISGVSAYGRRFTTVYPAGSRMGNDKPLTTTGETWWATQLGEMVLSTDAHPDGSVSNTSLRDVNLAEPDPALFQIPPGYRVVDEAAAFTIQLPVPKRR